MGNQKLLERPGTAPSHQARALLAVAADAQNDDERQALSLTPRRDYKLLAQALNAQLCDYGGIQKSRLGRLAGSILGRGPTQALAAMRDSRCYDVLFSDNEYVGLFLGIMFRWARRRPRHVLLAHHLTPRKKRLLAKLARPGIDTLIVHSHAQRDFAIAHLGFRPDVVRILPYQVDTQFWRARPDPEQLNLICTAGLECRDYDTLLAAISGLDVDLRIGAASNWSRKRNSLAGRTLPAHVLVKTYDYISLRALYSSSAFVVVPLLDVDFQAGVTTILEGMAMGKAVITTGTRGQRGVVLGPTWSVRMTGWPENGPSAGDSTGIYTLPGDVAGLNSAIRFLLDNPSVANMLGHNGRLRVERNFTVEHFVDRFSEAILRAG